MSQYISFHISDVGNNCAKGHCTEGAELMHEVVDAVTVQGFSNYTLAWCWYRLMIRCNIVNENQTNI